MLCEHSPSIKHEIDYSFFKQTINERSEHDIGKGENFIIDLMMGVKGMTREFTSPGVRDLGKFYVKQIYFQNSIHHFGF